MRVASRTTEAKDGSEPDSAAAVDGLAAEADSDGGRGALAKLPEAAAGGLAGDAATDAGADATGADAAAAALVAALPAGTLGAVWQALSAAPAKSAAARVLSARMCSLEKVLR